MGKAEAFVFLDQQYSNPRVVAQQVTKEFLGRKKLDGHNDEAKLINLYEIMNQCFLTLNIVGQASQLIDNQPMLALAVQLLPHKYRLSYADVLEKEEEAKNPPGILTAAE